MRERIERFSILPFSIGCVSQSSVDVVTQPKKSHSEPNPSTTSEEGDEKTKGSNIGERLQKIVKGFKSFPQVFQLHREEDDDNDDNEVEMEIGLPTDVQHVGHIGWDGSNSITTTNMKSWNRAPAELLSNFPSLSLRQFELAMAKEGAAAAAATL